MLHSKLALVSDEDLDRVHRASLRILEQTGMVIDQDDALALLADAGCRVDMPNKRVYFPPELVMEQVQRKPCKVLLAGRRPERDLVLGEGGAGFKARPLIGPESIMDHRTGEVRPSIMQDIREWATTVDALPYIDFIGVPSPSDVPLISRDVAAAGLAIQYTTKHMHTQVPSGPAIEYLAAISQVIAGSREEARRRPPISSYSVCISPLHLAKTGAERIFAAGKHGIPVGLNSTPIMGATGPITIPGIVAQLNAEILGQNTLLQLAHPGTAVLYAARPLGMDMKTTLASYNMIEAVLAVGLTVQLAKQKYGFITDVVGPSTDSKALDYQSAMERTWTSMLPILVGSDIMIAASGIDSCATGSLAQLVLDDDMLMALKRMVEGITIDDESLAVDTVRQVGPRGQFLETDLTLKHFRTAFCQSRFFDRNFRAAWEKRRHPQVADAASARIEEILRDHRVEPLADGQVRQIDEIVKEAQAAMVKAEV